MTTTISTIAAGICILIAYYVVFVGLVTFLLKTYLRLPFEWVRKMLHIGYTMSIFLYLRLFGTWYAAIFALVILALLFYIGLAIAERFLSCKKLLPERKNGDFRRQLLLAQLSLAILIFLFWGILGTNWIYVPVVAVMVWGFGDAAAALVGKTFGQRKLKHPWIEGTKTLEGTSAMLVIVGLAIFFTLMIYAGKPWYASFTVALFVAPISAVVELFSKKGSDTLTVPLSTAILTLALMASFSI